MKFKIIIICLFFVTVLLSCKKEDPITAGNANGVINKNIPVLTKVLTDNQPSYEYVYTSANLLSEEKSKFYFTINQYDGNNQLISTDYYSNANLLSTDLQLVQTAMDQKEWVTPESPNKGGTIKYDYSDANRLIKATYTPVSGTSQYSEFSYDANGKISKQILYWADIQTGYVEYSYDAKGNLVKEMLYNLSVDGVGALSTTTSYEFDTQVNPFRLVNRLVIPGINTNMNNITKETFTINEAASQGADPVQVTVTTWEYNDKGYPTTKNGNIAYIYG